MVDLIPFSTSSVFGARGISIELGEQDSFVEFEYDFLALEAEDSENWESGVVKRNAGNDLILKGPFGSPHGQSLDLIGSDDTKPELEGFVMQTDDEPTSIAGKGVGFDEWNLPSTTIEHASILEQLLHALLLHISCIIIQISTSLFQLGF
ncbi:hypothetical protein ACFX2I_005681 [Malus domestica]|nr:uncharacterized protein LOC114823242 [Malus domestica]